MLSHLVPTRRLAGSNTLAVRTGDYGVDHDTAGGPCHGSRCLAVERRASGCGEGRPDACDLLTRLLAECVHTLQVAL